MTVSAINPYQPPPPALGTTYGNIMDAFFSTLSEAEKQAIWVAFLAANNLTDPVPPGSEQLFLTYIQQAMANEKLFVPTFTNAILSPDEIKKRNIMFGVFNSVLNMLLSLQSTITVESQNLAFFARWQKEYTEMLTRVPSYVGNESSAISVNMNDLSKFTIGYDGISIQDIARWWAQQRLNGSNESFKISGFSTYLLINGTFTEQYTTLSFDPTSISLSNTFSQTTPPLSFGGVNGIFGTPIASGATFDELVSNFETAFRQFFTTAAPVILPSWSAGVNTYRNSNILPGAGMPGSNFVESALLIQAQIFSGAGVGSSDPYGLMQVLKPYTYVSPSSFTDPANFIKALSDANAKSRSELNSRDQQYIENVRSKRQIVQDVQSQIQANLDQSRQTLTQQTDLLTSIIESLKGLLASIFR